jgi:proline racemase
MLQKRAWAARHADHLRRVLMLEPRGHADMSGAVLTEPTTPGSHAGVLFMHTDGYSTMSGHGVIALTTIALERGLLMPGGEGRTVVLDTPAGTVRATATWSADTAGETGARRVERVRFVGVPSFVVEGGLTVAVGTRRIRADIAFGGAFYAIVDSEAVGLPIDRAHLPELRRVAGAIKDSIEARVTLAHPREPLLEGLSGIIFTAPPMRPEADLRALTIFGDAQADRSPSGTGTAAVMAVIDAMGLLSEDRPFVQESVLGTMFAGRLTGRTVVGDVPAIVPEIEGSAWITGEHTFFVDESDPLGAGFTL